MSAPDVEAIRVSGEALAAATAEHSRQIEEFGCSVRTIRPTVLRAAYLVDFAALLATVERYEKALRHVTDEINSQLQAGVLRNRPLEDRRYWTQVAIVGTAALAPDTTEAGT